MNDKHIFHRGRFHLHYRKTGSGEACWLIFHGFGQSLDHMNPIAALLKDEAAVYSFDLFFHGNSWFEGDEPIERNEWLKVMEAFFVENGIRRFSMAGFSIGCRLMTPLIESFSENIDQAIFIAPDGISTNIWYRLATGRPLRNFFRFIAVYPKAFYKITGALKRLPLVGRHVLRFAELQMSDRKRRLLVYRTWMAFRKLQAPARILARNLNKNRVSTAFILGDSDRIIKEKAVRPLTRRLYRYDVVRIDANHRDLPLKAAEAVKAIARHNGRSSTNKSFS